MSNVLRIRNLFNIQERFLWFANELYTLFLALKDPRAGFLPRILSIVGVLYVLSPLDIVPDVLPLIGIVDDALTIPVVITAVKILIPPPVLEAASRHATDSKVVTRLWWAIVFLAGLLVVVWIAAFIGIIYLIATSI